jgi:hypothetical protein
LHVLIVIFILWPFASDETWEGASGRGSRVALVEMRDETGMNGSVGEVALSV